jgi:WD domain, G-beta repeat
MSDEDPRRFGCKWGRIGGLLKVGKFSGCLPSTMIHLGLEQLFLARSNELGCEDQTIRIWDVETGAVVSGPFQGHSHWIAACVAFSHDSKRVVSGSGDRTIRKHWSNCVWSFPRPHWLCYVRSHRTANKSFWDPMAVHVQFASGMQRPEQLYLVHCRATPALLHLLHSHRTASELFRDHGSMGQNDLCLECGCEGIIVRNIIHLFLLHVFSARWLDSWSYYCFGFHS